MPSRHRLPEYRIAVVGAGAVGGYYGGKLAAFGRDVHFLIRSEEERAVWRRHGLRIKSAQGDTHIAKVQAHATTEEIGPVDLVLIAIKATANDALDKLIPPLLGPETVLLTLQNGLGSDDALAERFGAGRVTGGLCFVCLNRTAPGVIEHTGHGAITLGEYARFPTPRVHDIVWEFKRCGIPAHAVADLATERWRKLVWNIPFNGLTILDSALAGEMRTVADLLADDDWSYLVRRLMDETIAVAGRLGHAIPPDWADAQYKRTKEMGAYRPSTLIDYLAGREIELEAIWGEPYRRAFNAGAECGRLETLYYQLRHIARQRAAPM